MSLFTVYPIGVREGRGSVRENPPSPTPQTTSDTGPSIARKTVTYVIILR